MVKMADGIHSGRYSNRTDFENMARPELSNGISPRMFKNMTCQGHTEFESMRQQDAFEFFLYFLKRIEQCEKPLKFDSTAPFRFELEERLQCTSCQRVRYSNVAATSISLPIPSAKIPNASQDTTDANKYQPTTLEACFKSWSATEMIDGYSCAVCKKPCTVMK